jgi:hypothetical protein
MVMTGVGLTSCFAGAVEAKGPVVHSVERRHCRPFAFIADVAILLFAATVGVLCRFDGVRLYRRRCCH